LHIVCTLCLFGGSWKTVKAQHIDSLLKNYNDSIWNYRNSDPDKALEFSRKAIALHSKDTSEYTKGITFLRTGIVFDLQSNPDSAIEYYHRAVNIAEKANLSKLKMYVANNLGLVYWNQDKLQDAIKQYLVGLKFAEELHDTMSMGHACNNLGLVFVRMRNFEKSNYYHEKAAEYFSQMKNNEALASALNNLLLSVPDTSTQAFLIQKKVIEIQESIPDEYGLGKSYSNMALRYLARGNQAKAYECYLKSEYYHKKVRNLNGLASTHLNLGALLNEMNRTDQAIFYLEEALQLAKKTGNRRTQLNVQHLLAKIYFSLGKYKTAYTFLDSSYNLNFNIYNVEMAKNLEELEAEYDIVKKENEILQLREEEKEVKLSLAKSEIAQTRKDIIIYSLCGLILLASGGVYLGMKWRGYRQRLQADQQRERAVFETEQKERIRIARDLHDSIGQKMAYMKMLMSTIEAKDEETSQKLTLISSNLDETTQEVRQISHNLFPEALNLGLVKAVKAISDKINETSTIKLEVVIPDDFTEPEIEKDVQVSLYRIIQEAMHNMIKHSEASLIRILLGIRGSALQLVIEDNGKGMDVQTIHDSQGLGWQNIFARARLINAKLQVNSEKKKGTSLMLSLNLPA